MNDLLECRICKSKSFAEVVNLGKQTITSRFPILGDNSTPKTDICLVLCANCNLVQLKHTTNSDELYEHFYGYRSGINSTMRNHLNVYNNQIHAMITFTQGDAVLDIGSNDCTFLSYYPADVKRYGCDPTGKQFLDFYKQESVVLIPTYFSKETIQSQQGNNLRFKVVSSISMFYDLPDPVKFAKDVFDLLDDDGIWTLEQSYVATMLERNSIDTICHEHLEYYGVKQIKNIMDIVGFKIIDISLNECNGGSFRTFVAKKSSTKFTEATELINSFLQKENDSGIHTVERYSKFLSDCNEQVRKLNVFLELLKKDGKSLYIYGASTKGNCLLQFANIDSNKAKYAVERNPLKVGRMTSTGIEIISEETMRKDPPAYMLVLPWHFRNEIIEREKNFLDNGGQLVFPFPQFEIYNYKPKTLITGVDGQIGQYVYDALSSSDSLYGITKKKKI